MKTTVDFNIQSGLSIAASFQSIGIEVSPYSQISIQVNFNQSGATSVGTMTIEQSNDKVNWATTPSTSQAVNNTVNNLVYNFATVTARYVRVAYTFTSGLGGSAAIVAHATL